MNLLVSMAYCADTDSFPNKPIRLVVYTKPGGAIDTTARKFADVAARYSDATFVVENKPGAGGIVAMKDVLQSKPDGYTLLACTKSNVAKIVATGDASLISAFHWVGMMMADPECVITRRDIRPSTWADLVADASQKATQGDRQIWAGPAFGGLDHVTAMKTWEKSGINAVWVPFQSGGKAKAELLGGRSVAYVGNPSEVRANPDRLMVAAVASPIRLSQFPDVPTFEELGLTGLSQEIMWRGFALRSGVQPNVVSWYEELLRNVSQDSSWREFYEKDGIEVAFHDSETFSETVRRDHKDFTTYLGQLGILKSDTPATVSRALSSWYPLAGIGALALAICIGLRKIRGHSDGVSADYGESAIPIVLLLLGGLLLVATMTFPSSDEVGAAAVPRLWLAAMLPLCVVLLIQSWKPAGTAKSVESEGDEETKGGVVAVVPFFVLLLAYSIALVWLGYYVSTFLFLFAAMMLLGERKILRVVGVTAGWLAFSYFVFARLLFVPLPTGRLLERFF